MFGILLATAFHIVVLWSEYEGCILIVKVDMSWTVQYLFGVCVISVLLTLNSPLVYLKSVSHMVSCHVMHVQLFFFSVNS